MSAVVVSIASPRRVAAYCNGSAAPGKNSPTPSIKSCGAAMPNWAAYVREPLRLSDIRPPHEQDVVDDLAGQLEEAYSEAIGRGVSEEDAVAAAGAHITDWSVLAKQVAQRPTIGWPALVAPQHACRRKWRSHCCCWPRPACSFEVSRMPASSILASRRITCYSVPWICSRPVTTARVGRNCSRVSSTRSERCQASNPRAWRQAARLTSTGVVIGLPLAMGASLLGSTLLVGVRPLDVTTFAGTSW